MWVLLKRFYTLFTRREKILALLVMALFAITSISELFSLGFIFVYVKLIIDPAQLQSLPPLLALQEIIGIPDHKEFMLFLGCLLLAVFVLKTALGIFNAWVSMRFAMGRMAAFSADLYHIYLSKNYPYFLQHNTNALKKNILEEIFNAVLCVLMPMLLVISEAMVLGFIVCFLLFLYPVQTGIMFVLAGGFFGLYVWRTHAALDRLGAQKEHANQERYQLAGDALSVFKEITIWDARWTFVSRFREILRSYSHSMSWHYISMQLPRHLIEAMGLLLIMILIISYLLVADNPAQMIPAIMLYGAAGMRMMPSFNRITMGLSQIRFYKRSLPFFYNDLLLRRSLPAAPSKTTVPPAPLPFTRTIAFCGVSFAYAEGAEKVVDSVSLVIEKNTSVAFVGGSGAGKSTVAEMLLGLLVPVSGDICIDGVPLSGENIDAWREYIGYIPQRIFLLDGSIAENVAFGVEAEKIDMEQVRWACKIAHIDEFIEENLPEGYHTQVGEQGVLLSGGQAQRIAIARALYRRPSVLIMDEATAAMDGITEGAITEALEALGGKMTIIMVAHRMNTVRQCDVIYVFHRGRIIDKGTYPELLERNEMFREMSS